MKRFLAGTVFGLLLGVAAAATAAQLVGRTGYLTGWDVTVSGVTMCSDPYVWVNSREIVCD